jgi:hypothetical protein
VAPCTPAVSRLARGHRVGPFAEPALLSRGRSGSAAQEGAPCYTSRVTQPFALDQAVEALKRDPTRAVRARVGDMTVELRAVPDSPPAVERSAADALREIGPWEGESYEELVALFAGVRQRTSRLVPNFDR